MALEIKELVVRVHVTQNTKESKSGQATSLSSSLLKKIVQDCYEKVMHDLERQKYR